MTTKFPTREVALQTGIHYVRGKVDIEIEDLRKIEGDINQFGVPLGADIYELENAKGEKAIIAVSPFRDGYDLWLCAPSGICVRV